MRHIGLSTHHVDLASKVLDMGILDVLMFSINPAYDYDRGEYSDGGAKKRMELYRRCKKEGVGITVMKAFGGGKLLSDDQPLYAGKLCRNMCVLLALYAMSGWDRYCARKQVLRSGSTWRQPGQEILFVA